ncbi:MAG TPA: hypothetical protein VK771_11230 [Acidimicrobiia bacterium]|nr:hypothetical protein [Acidimicrobiia bacterium]
MNVETLAPTVRRGDRFVVVALGVLAALALAVAADIVGFVVVLIPIALLFVGFVVLVARRPVAAAYVFLATQPFVGGIDRGHLIPLLRPSEAIQAVLTAAVICGVLVRVVRGERLSVRITKLDRAIVLLCVLSSIWPLCWMFARGRIPSSTDLFDTVVLWRLASLYVLFRWVVRTPEQVRRCLWILLVSASLLSMLAILDSLGIWRPGGLWTPTISDNSTGRGGATLGSAIAVGDYLSYSFAVVLVWLLRTKDRGRLILAAAAGMIFLGVLGTGQFSAWIEAFIVVLVVAHQEGQLARLTKWLGPAALVGAVIAWPVISTRLAGFGGGGLPHSWQGRIDNLTHFYLPQLAGFHWVLGIRPDTVLQAPETWRQVIYLESGYLWLFWVGGIPLVCGFLWLLRQGFRHTRRVMRERHDDIAIAAVGTRAVLWSLLIMSLIDPHLTLRGGADLFFCLLGLSANLNVPRGEPEPEEDPLPDIAYPWVRQSSGP